MKKIFTLIAVVAVSLVANAQCTINPNVFTSATDYGILPDTIVNLPVAYVATPYTTDLQVHVAPDTTVPNVGTFPIQDITIDSVSGIPANFSYLPNPANGVMPGGSYGCVAVTGNAVQGQEVGGPNNNGVYPLVVHFTATVLVFNVPTEFPATWDGYKLVIQPANSVSAENQVLFSVSNPAPNPSDRRTELRYSVPADGVVEFTMYNALGSQVQKKTLDARRGYNEFVLETGTLAAGVYMYSFKMGDTIITRRLTISH